MTLRKSSRTKWGIGRVFDGVRIVVRLALPLQPSPSSHNLLHRLATKTVR
jgi:hypothetical protein